MAVPRHRRSDQLPPLVRECAAGGNGRESLHASQPCPSTSRHSPALQQRHRQYSRVYLNIQ